MMKAVLAGARHAKYRQSALRTVLPRLQQLEHYLDLIHSDEKRGQIRLLLQKAPPLQWYLTNHPTLARKAVLRDADRKTLALARLLYQLKTQDCSQIEQLYILHKIYKNPAQAVSIQVDQIHPDYCIDRLLKKITGSWGKVSEVAMVRTNPPSYESERQIMNEFTMLILKQCAELSRELDIPMDEIVSLKKWSFDGDGKDFPDTHQIYHMLSTQVTLFTELRISAKERTFGPVGRSLNQDVPGFISLFKKTARKIKKEKEIPTALSTFGQVGGVLTRQVEGTGLGLSIVRSLVQLLDGDFDIESTVGEGTLVTVTIPRACQPEQEVPASPVTAVL